MPWFVPPAGILEAQAEWIFPGTPFEKHKIGRWPHPNTPRTNSWFIMEHSTFLAHTAHKRLWCWTMLQSIDTDLWPTWLNLGWYDLEAVAPGKLIATSDVNEFGWVASQRYENLDVLPELGGPGVEFELKISHPATGHFLKHTYEFPLATDPWQFARDGLPVFAVPETIDESPVFPYGDVKPFEWAMSDCFLFPRSMQAPLDFAEFNGIDSKIQFDQFTNTHNQRFRLVAEIRLYVTDLAIILGRSNNTTRAVRVRPHNIQWRSGVVNFSPDIPIEEWGFLRIDHNWVDGPASGWKVYWNDVLIGTAGAGVSQLFFDEMGHQANNYGAKMDMRNFTFEDTDPAVPRLLLSCELTVNACDIGEKMMIGTTENMTLSSCPP